MIKRNKALIYQYGGIPHFHSVKHLQLLKVCGDQRPAAAEALSRATLGGRKRTRFIQSFLRGLDTVHAVYVSIISLRRFLQGEDGLSIGIISPSKRLQRRSNATHTEQITATRPNSTHVSRVCVVTLLDNKIGHY